MLALVSQPSAPYAQLSEVDDPRPLPHEALVQVRAISLNRGECRRLEAMEPGSVTGWDLAGVVAEAAADGSGPAAGARVVGLKNPGAWVQRAAVDTEYLAELPDEVSFQQASTLPVAGLTALMSLDIGGFVVGRRVLVTGASGGVGRFAIQLAKLGGAHVTALARRTEGLVELGADEAIQELTPGGEDFDVILDGVGGTVLGTCLQRVAPLGTVVSFASTLTEPVSYPAREFFVRAAGAQLVGFYLFAALHHSRRCATDLRRLAELIADGRVDPQIDVVAPWDEAGRAIGSLMDRQVAGKAVLDVA
jgi:NADPH:quinone reductase-like Zn-dependent oxidoreductase